MYTPSYRVRGRGVPILSKPEIDTIGENFVRDFQPSVLTNPAPVDIESFVENYLGMTPDYQLLSHNGIYLGMTVFNDTNRVIVFSQETGRAEYISAKAHTVIIDTRLLEENQQHRYRFIICHCEGHDLGIASNHADVLHWWPKHGKNMDTFRAAVKEKLRCSAEHTLDNTPAE